MSVFLPLHIITVRVPDRTGRVTYQVIYDPTRARVDTVEMPTELSIPRLLNVPVVESELLAIAGVDTREALDATFRMMGVVVVKERVMKVTPLAYECFLHGDSIWTPGYSLDDSDYLMAAAEAVKHWVDGLPVLEEEEDEEAAEEEGEDEDELEDALEDDADDEEAVETASRTSARDESPITVVVVLDANGTPRVAHDARGRQVTVVVRQESGMRWADAPADPTAVQALLRPSAPTEAVVQRLTEADATSRPRTTA